MSLVLKPTDRTTLITHKSCLDGTGSALMFLWAGGRRDRVLFRNPSKLIVNPEELPTDVDEVWYADCCPPDLANPCAGLPFRVFDHHVSNQRRHGGDSRCLFDQMRSGTSLMARELGLRRGSHDSERLIRALEAYDLGHFYESDGMYLADLAATYSQDEMLDNLVEHGVALFDIPTMSARVEAARSMRNSYAETALRSVLYAHLDNARVGLTSAPVYWKNEVAERILDSGRADVAIIFDAIGGMVSLRSRPGGPDCSIIAGKYGGGGHARAAGFKVSSHQMLDAMSQEVFG